MCLKRKIAITLMSLFCWNAWAADVEQCPLAIEGAAEIHDMFCGEDPQIITFEIFSTAGSTPIDISFISVFPAPGNTSSSTTSVIGDSCNGTVPPLGSCFVEVEVVPVACEGEEFPQQIVRDLVIVPEGFCTLSARFDLQVNEPDAPLIAGGNYDSSGSIMGENNTQATVQYPMLFVSNDLGNTWNYKVEFDRLLPADFSELGAFQATDCSEESCVAVGEYIDADFIRYPMILASTNRGVNWKYKIDKTTGALPREFQNDGFLFDASCAGDTCAVIGQYTALNNNVYPILAVSTDGTQSWSYEVDKKPYTLPFIYDTAGIFYDVACSGDFCIAGGEYLSLPAPVLVSDFPMLITSSNRGINWDYQVDGRSATLPNNFQLGGRFVSVTCANNSCAAVGNYLGSSTLNLMLAVSTDMDTIQSWDYKIEEGLNPPTDFISNGVFTQISCADEVCAAGGNYRDSLNVQYPVLAVSIDGGDTWNYKVEKLNNLPVGFTSNGSFESVSCSDDLCVAAGFYFFNSIRYPMLIESTNGGVTWVYKVERGLNTPPSFSNQGRFTNVECDDDQCGAIGRYNASARPMFIVTADGGTTWTYKVSNANLPTTYQSLGSGLATVSCSTDICLAGGGYRSSGIDYPLLSANPNGLGTYSFIVDRANNLPDFFTDDGFFGTSEVSSFESEFLKD